MRNFAEESSSMTKNQKISEDGDQLPQSKDLIHAALGGAILGLLALALVEGVLAMAGCTQLLMAKLGAASGAQVDGSSLGLSAFLHLLRTNDKAQQAITFLVVLTAVIGGILGVIDYRLRPTSRGWLLPWLQSVGLGISLLALLALIAIGGTIYDQNDAIMLIFDTWWFRLLLLLLAANISTATLSHLQLRILPSLQLRINKTPAVYLKARLGKKLVFEGQAEQLEQALKRHRYQVRREGEFLTARKGTLNRFGSTVAHVGFITLLLGGFLTGMAISGGDLFLVEGGDSVNYIQPRPARDAGMNDPNPAPIPLGFVIRCLDFDTGVHPQTNIPSKFISTVEIIDSDRRFIDTVEVNKSLKYKGYAFHQSDFGEVNEERRLLLVTDSTSGEELELEVNVGSASQLTGALQFSETEAPTVRLTSHGAGLYYEIVEGGTIVARRYLSSEPGGQLLTTGPFTVEVHAPETDEFITSCSLQLNQEVPLTTAGLSVMATEYLPEFTMIEDNGQRQVVSRSNQPNNPALQVVVLENGQPLESQWLFWKPELRGFSHTPSQQFWFTFTAFSTMDEQAAEPLSEFVSERYTVRDGGPTQPYYTVLSVSRNPVIPLIYLGCLLMCLGLFLAFYLPARSVLLWHRPEKKEALGVAVYRQEQPNLTRDIERLFADLERAGAKKP